MRTPSTTVFAIQSVRIDDPSAEAGGAAEAEGACTRAVGVSGGGPVESGDAGAIGDDRGGDIDAEPVVDVPAVHPARITIPTAASANVVPTLIAIDQPSTTGSEPL